MKTITEHILLFLACCFCLQYSEWTSDKVVCILVAIAASEFIMLSKKKYETIIINCLYIIFCLFVPFGIAFYPVIFFDIVPFNNTYLYLVSLVIVFIQAPLISPIMLAYCLFCMVVAYFTAKYSKERIEQLQVIHQTNDSKEELQMMMEAKNKELIRRQEDEIHMATLQERNRIAREIHDNVGHMLTRAILLTAAMKTQTNFQQSEELTVLKQTLDTAMNEIRSSVHDLHDEAIDLKESIHGIIQNYSFCPIALDYDMEEEVEREIKVCFIAVIKEALSNTAKHSNATQVTILVREHPALYQLLIQDNGSKQESSKEHGIGIENMEERVKSLHGQISITNQNGYRIFISIPKKG